MSLEEQQEEQKVTNHYRVEITEFQEDSQDSEGKKHILLENHIWISRQNYNWKRAILT